MSSNGTNVWGGYCKATTPITLEEGTLTFGAADPETAYGRLSLIATDISLQKTARLNANLWVYDASSLNNPNRFSLTGGSAAEIYCAERYIATGYINIDYIARMAIRSPVIKLESCKVSLSSDAAPHGASLFMECIPQTVQSDFPLLRVTDSILECAKAATVTIRMQHAQPLVFLDSKVSVQDSAAVEIHADNLAFPDADPTRFEIAGPGPCTIKFYGATPDTQAFDFVTNTYSPGLFRFSKRRALETRDRCLSPNAATPSSTPTCWRRSCCASTIRRRIKAMFDQQYVRGDLIIKLK